MAIPKLSVLWYVKVKSIGKIFFEVEVLSLKAICLCRTLSYRDNDLHVNLGFNSSPQAMVWTMSYTDNGFNPKSWFKKTCPTQTKPLTSFHFQNMSPFLCVQRSAIDGNLAEAHQKLIIKILLNLFAFQAFGLFYD